MSSPLAPALLDVEFGPHGLGAPVAHGTPPPGGVSGDKEEAPAVRGVRTGGCGVAWYEAVAGVVGDLDPEDAAERWFGASRGECHPDAEVEGEGRARVKGGVAREFGDDEGGSLGGRVVGWEAPVVEPFDAAEAGQAGAQRGGVERDGERADGGRDLLRRVGIRESFRIHVVTVPSRR